MLDFVANVDRLLFLRDIADKISRFAGKGEFSFDQNKLFLEGDNYNLFFDDQLIDLLKVLEQLKGGLYASWPEASKAAIALGVEDHRDYQNKRRQDYKLPYSPNEFYDDFPGWDVFLDRYYWTWQEASKATIALGIKDSTDYHLKYKLDPKLPSSPYSFYDDFPGWKIFTSTYYETWQEASKAAVVLGINSQLDHFDRYQLDPKLPKYPQTFYKDFPGWRVFLEMYYPTWQEAAKAAIALGAKIRRDYKAAYVKDPKLPGNPANFYKDFPSWRVFLERYYRTWQEASRAAIALGIKNCVGYKEKYKLDPKLHNSPLAHYKDFPGWHVFLDMYYQTWPEASRAAIALGIKGQLDYQHNHKKDCKLPFSPRSFYDDFPGWTVFLGK